MRRSAPRFPVVSEPGYRGKEEDAGNRLINVDLLPKMWKPPSASGETAKSLGAASCVPPCISVSMSGLQGALRSAHDRVGRPFFRQVSDLPAHGPECVDWKDVHQSAGVGGLQDSTGRTKMAVRVLPPQFCRFSEAQGSVHVPALEEVRAPGGRSPGGTESGRQGGTGKNPQGRRLRTP